MSPQGSPLTAPQRRLRSQAPLQIRPSEHLKAAGGFLGLPSVHEQANGEFQALDLTLQSSVDRPMLTTPLFLPDPLSENLERTVLQL